MPGTTARPRQILAYLSTVVLVLFSSCGEPDVTTTTDTTVTTTVTDTTETTVSDPCADANFRTVTSDEPCALLLVTTTVEQGGCINAVTNGETPTEAEVTSADGTTRAVAIPTECADGTCTLSVEGITQSTVTAQIEWQLANCVRTTRIAINCTSPQCTERGIGTLQINLGPDPRSPLGSPRTGTVTGTGPR